MTVYTTINHGMMSTFVERWHSEMISFYHPRGEISITLDDVSSLIHLLIRGRLLHHSRITRPDELEMLVNFL